MHRLLRRNLWIDFIYYPGVVVVCPCVWWAVSKNQRCTVYYSNSRSILYVGLWNIQNIRIRHTAHCCCYICRLGVLSVPNTMWRAGEKPACIRNSFPSNYCLFLPPFMYSNTCIHFEYTYILFPCKFISGALSCKSKRSWRTGDLKTQVSQVFQVHSGKGTLTPHSYWQCIPWITLWLNNPFWFTGGGRRI